MCTYFLWCRTQVEYDNRFLGAKKICEKNIRNRNFTELGENRREEINTYKNNYKTKKKKIKDALSGLWKYHSATLVYNIMNTSEIFAANDRGEEHRCDDDDDHDGDECRVTAVAAVRHDTAIDTPCVRRARCGGATSEVVVTTTTTTTSAAAAAAAETSPKAVTRVKCHARATHPTPLPVRAGSARADRRARHAPVRPPATTGPPTNFVAQVIMIFFTRAHVISICPK